MAKHKRSFWNYFLAPREQLGFSVRMVVGVFLLTQLQVFAVTAARLGGASFSASTVAVFVFSSLFVLVYTMVVTHRVFGPVRAMEIYVDKLLAGENPPPMRLRGGDYFGGLAERLSKLATRHAPPEG